MSMKIFSIILDKEYTVIYGNCLQLLQSERIRGVYYNTFLHQRMESILRL